MKPNNIDNLFKSKLGKENFQYNAAHWAQVEEQIKAFNQRKNPKKAFYLRRGFYAIIGALFLTGILYTIYSSTTNQNTQLTANQPESDYNQRGFEKQGHSEKQNNQQRPNSTENENDKAANGIFKTQGNELNEVETGNNKNQPISTFDNVILNRHGSSSNSNEPNGTFYSPIDGNNPNYNTNSHNPSSGISNTYEDEIGRMNKDGNHSMNNQGINFNSRPNESDSQFINGNNSQNDVHFGSGFIGNGNNQKLGSSIEENGRASVSSGAISDQNSSLQFLSDSFDASLELPKPYPVLTSSKSELKTEDFEIPMQKAKHQLGFDVGYEFSYFMNQKTLLEAQNDNWLSYRSDHETLNNHFDNGLRLALNYGPFTLSSGFAIGQFTETTNYSFYKTEYEYDTSLVLLRKGHPVNGGFVWLLEKRVDSTGTNVIDNSKSGERTNTFSYYRIPLNFGYKFSLSRNIYLAPTLGLVYNRMTKSLGYHISNDLQDLVDVSSTTNQQFFTGQLGARLAYKYKRWELGTNVNYSTGILNAQMFESFNLNQTSVGIYFSYTLR